MSKQGKKFISPGAWFSLIYPSAWNEFEDTEGSFLFYNPTNWNGNFRISAFKADAKLPQGMQYGKEAVLYELQHNSNAVQVRVGSLDCAYSKESFLEEGKYYVTHLWIAGIDNVAFECSFTVPRGSEVTFAEDIIATLDIRRDGKRYPIEIIPIRIVEISLVNEAFEWASSTIKKQLKKDFTSVAEDIPKIQQVMENGTFKPQNREVWESFGIAFGTILVNEIDGMEWVTVIDESREYPALRFRESPVMMYPLQLIWERMKSDRPCYLEVEYEEVRREVEKELEKE